MPLKTRVNPSRKPVRSVPLAREPYRAAVEQAVSDHVGRPWTIAGATDMSDYACHPAAILSDGAYPVFAKFSDAPNGAHQFQAELAGLSLLSDLAGVLTPTPIGIAPAGGGCILVMEAVQPVPRTPHHWRQIGRTLARIHAVKGSRFGFKTGGYFGPLPQDNTPSDDRVTFYVERRLAPALRLALQSGHLPPEVARRVDSLIARFPELCGPEGQPALLHGDAQQNNYISTGSGTVVIDPAVYYGNPEVDLAWVDAFEKVKSDLLEGYQQEQTIDPGFWERRGLWQVCGFLSAVTVEGPRHLGRLNRALQSHV